MRLWVRRYRKRERLYIGAVASFLERHGLSIGVWKQGFDCFRSLIGLAEYLVQQSIRGSCLLGKMNILLTISAASVVDLNPTYLCLVVNVNSL